MKIFNLDFYEPLCPRHNCSQRPWLSLSRYVSRSSSSLFLLGLEAESELTDEQAQQTMEEEYQEQSISFVDDPVREIVEALASETEEAKTW